MDQSDYLSLYGWVSKWRTISIALLITGAVGAAGPYTVDICDFTGSLAILNDVAVLLRGYEYYFGMCFIFGYMLIYCVGEFEANILPGVLREGKRDG